MMQPIIYGSNCPSRFSECTCVRADVALEEPRTRERLAAVRTLASLAVRPDVHRESGNRHVNFVAVRTPSCLGNRIIKLIRLIAQRESLTFWSAGDRCV